MNTPETITELKENEIFVFGSNLDGEHWGGAARLAYDKFGALWGVGSGVSGKTYAIPTLARPASTTAGELQKLHLAEIECFVETFFIFASYHPHLKFLVTKIGCGIAGFTIPEIATLFMFNNEGYKRNIPENVILPKEFYE